MSGEKAEKRSRSFEDLGVWQKAHQLTLTVYRLTASFPAAERYGLVSQMRRAAVSVPANIAEGFGKRGTRDKLNYYNIARGSLEELRYYAILARDLGYASTTADTLALVDEVGRMLHGLSRAIRARDSGSEPR